MGRLSLVRALLRKPKVRMAIYAAIFVVLLVVRWHRPLRALYYTRPELFNYLQANARAETDVSRRKRIYNEIIRTFGREDDPEADGWVVWAMRRFGEELSYPSSTSSGTDVAMIYRYPIPPPPPEAKPPVYKNMLRFASNEVRRRVLGDALESGHFGEAPLERSDVATAWVDLALATDSTAEAVVVYENLLRELAGEQGAESARARAWAMAMLSLSPISERERGARLAELLGTYGENRDPYIVPLVLNAMLREADRTPDKTEAIARFDAVVARFPFARDYRAVPKIRALLGKAERIDGEAEKLAIYDSILELARGSRDRYVNFAAAEVWLLRAGLTADPAEKIALYDEFIERNRDDYDSRLRKIMHEAGLARERLVRAAGGEDALRDEFSASSGRGQERAGTSVKSANSFQSFRTRRARMKPFPEHTAHGYERAS